MHTKNIYTYQDIVCEVVLHSWREVENPDNDGGVAKVTRDTRRNGVGDVNSVTSSIANSSDYGGLSWISRWWVCWERDFVFNGRVWFSGLINAYWEYWSCVNLHLCIHVHSFQHSEYHNTNITIIMHRTAGAWYTYTITTTGWGLSRETSTE